MPNSAVSKPLTRSGDGQHGIRINGQFRLCFVWHEGDAHDAETVANRCSQDGLREVVETFLEVVRADAARRTERIDGHSAPATLRVDGKAPVELTIRDISTGDIALWTNRSADPGTKVTLVLPGADGLVHGSVTQCSGDWLAVEVDKDNEAYALAERAFGTILAYPDEEDQRLAAAG